LPSHATLILQVFPIDAQQEISKKYAGYKFDETVEYNGQEGDHYFYIYDKRE
jgi:hypothetical protein